MLPDPDSKRRSNYINPSRRGETKPRAAKPFFLYLAFTAPHTPIVPTTEWQGKSGLDRTATL